MTTNSMTRSVGREWIFANTKTPAPDSRQVPVEGFWGAERRRVSGGAITPGSSADGTRRREDRW